MIPYVLLLFIPLLFSVIAFSSSLKKGSSKWILAVGGTREVTAHSFMLPVFFFLLIVLLSLRDISIGRDLPNYRYYFLKSLHADYPDILQEDREHLFFLLMWIVTRFTDNFQIFLAIVAVITVLPAGILYCRDRQYGLLKIALFLNMPTFIMLFSGLRQAIATSVGLIAYEFVRKKRPGCFLLAALIAFGFHTSAIMIFLFYPLYHVTFRRKHLWFVVPAILFVYACNDSLFVLAGHLLEHFLGDQYNTSITPTGAYTMLILFALLAAFSFILPDETKMDSETLGLRNLLLAALVLQCFVPLHSLAMRMNYYFVIFIPLLLPRLLQIPRQNMKKAAYLANVIMVSFFILYFLAGVYRGCRTGISALDTYPYVPFWK